MKLNEGKNIKKERQFIYIFKKIFELTNPHKIIIIRAIFLMLFFGLLAQVNPIIFKIILDTVSEILQDNNRNQYSILLISGLIGLMILKEIFLQSLNIYLGYIGEKIKVIVGTDMSDKACRHIASLDLDFFDREGNSPGGIVKRIDTGIEGMSKVIKNMIIDILPLIFTSVIAIIIMFNSNWKVGVLSFLIIPFFTYSSLRQAKINEGTRIKIQDSKEKRSESMINYIDSSAMEVLENLIISMKKYDIEVYFT